MGQFCVDFTPFSKVPSMVDSNFINPKITFSQNFQARIDVFVLICTKYVLPASAQRYMQCVPVHVYVDYVQQFTTVPMLCHFPSSRRSYGRHPSRVDGVFGSVWKLRNDFSNGCANLFDFRSRGITAENDEFEIWGLYLVMIIVTDFLVDETSKPGLQVYYGCWLFSVSLKWQGFRSGSTYGWLLPITTEAIHTEQAMSDNHHFRNLHNRDLQNIVLVVKDDE